MQQATTNAYSSVGNVDKENLLEDKHTQQAVIMGSSSPVMRVQTVIAIIDNLAYLIPPLLIDL